MILLPEFDYDCNYDFDNDKENEAKCDKHYQVLSKSISEERRFESLAQTKTYA